MDKQNNTVVRSWRRFFRLPHWLEMGLLGIASVLFIILGSIVMWAALVPIPSIENFENREVAQSTKIYDRTGNIVLYDVHGTMRRTAVPLDKISPYIRNAAIAVEDNTFYTNAGFRPLSFLRALYINLKTGSYSQGGSTITQQVVKNALLTQNKTIARKLEEIILSLRLTRIYSKDKILETYLNESSYGGTIYGVQEASQYFFGVDAADLTLAQAAYLAALPQAPTYYSPYGNHRDALNRRKDLVLSQMRKNNFISEEEYELAKKEVVQFRDEAEAGIKAPHFVFYVREYLEEKYGADVVDKGGLRVITTLDYDLQQYAEDTVSKYAPGMERNFNATNQGLVAIDPKTGQILTMVGSRGYFDEEIDGKYNIALAHRQPGSSFKPFAYATAFAKGYTPETVVFDVPTQFSTACQPHDITNSEPPCYSPGNFDGKFQGPMTLRNALAQSVNIPAIKTVYLAGVKDSISTAESMGITTLAGADRYGLTLVLGGGEVSLLELTGAYGVFANDGVRHPTTGILRVEDNRGTVLEQYEEQSTRVIDPQVARLINDVLSDNRARTPEFGANSPLYFPGYTVAAKTGTTNDYRDVWIAGYTPGISVASWAGNNDNTPMAKKIAAFIIAPMWHEFLEYAMEKYPADSFVPPSPEANPDSLPPVLRGEWNTDPSQGVHSILYWINKDDPRGPRPAQPQADPQFAYWDYAVQLWTNQATGTVNGGPISGPFSIITPAQGAFLQPLSPILFTASAQQPETITRVMYYLNGTLIGMANQPPYNVLYTPSGRGLFSLRAVAEHRDFSHEEQTITFTIQ